jgi:hypothetical protein
MATSRQIWQPWPHLARAPRANNHAISGKFRYKNAEAETEADVKKCAELPQLRKQKQRSVATLVYRISKY